jgi:hypothetical protein
MGLTVNVCIAIQRQCRDGLKLAAFFQNKTSRSGTKGRSQRQLPRHERQLAFVWTRVYQERLLAFCRSVTESYGAFVPLQTRMNSQEGVTEVCTSFRQRSSSSVSRFRIDLAFAHYYCFQNRSSVETTIQRSFSCHPNPLRCRLPHAGSAHSGPKFDLTRQRREACIRFRNCYNPEIS